MPFHPAAYVPKTIDPLVPLDSLVPLVLIHDPTMTHNCGGRVVVTELEFRVPGVHDCLLYVKHGKCKVWGQTLKARSYRGGNEML